MAIITKDEEANLGQCLLSVSFADDIVVVDSGSSDRTVQLAREHGCRVYEEDWKGFGPQKQSAVDKCEHEWVLLIDADERIPKETLEVIKRTLVSPEADAYTFKRKNFLHGRWIRHSDWWPDRQVRLVRKSRGRLVSVVHERWATEGGIVFDLNAHIEHYSFKDYSQMLIVLDNYTTALALELYRQGRRTNALAPVYHGFWAFVKIYFLKLGVLDGFDGFVIALLKAVGSFFKYAKLRELMGGGAARAGIDKAYASPRGWFFREFSWNNNQGRSSFKAGPPVRGCLAWRVKIPFCSPSATRQSLFRSSEIQWLKSKESPCLA